MAIPSLPAWMQSSGSPGFLRLPGLSTTHVNIGKLAPSEAPWNKKTLKKLRLWLTYGLPEMPGRIG
jgi:hypothetical protein